MLNISKASPPQKVAVAYYTSDDMYLFDAMHFDSSTGSTDESAAKAEPRRRPNIQTLYDVFRAVRDDEYEHVKWHTCKRIRLRAKKMKIGPSPEVHSVTLNQCCGLPIIAVFPIIQVQIVELRFRFIEIQVFRPK
jgi:hypothetical protein